MSRKEQSPPHTGAWIETDSMGCGCVAKACRPLTRGRGLKQERIAAMQAAAGSPPHTGAWIETLLQRKQVSTMPGRPLTRGRGLKPRPRST